VDVTGAWDGPAVSRLGVIRIKRVPVVQRAAVGKPLNEISAAARIVHESAFYEKVLRTAVIVVGLLDWIIVGDQPLTDHGAAVSTDMVVLHHAAGNES